MAEATEITAQKRALDVRAEEKPGERSAEAIRHDIAARRESISETVDRLGERIQGSLDWRQHVGNHPIAAVAIAAATGVLLSRLFRPQPSPTERIMDAVAEVVEDVTGQARNKIAGVIGSGIRRGFVKTSIGALAAQVVANLVKENLTTSTRSRRARPGGISESQVR